MGCPTISSINLKSFGKKKLGQNDEKKMKKRIIMNKRMKPSIAFISAAL